MQPLPIVIIQSDQYSVWACFVVGHIGSDYFYGQIILYKTREIAFFYSPIAYTEFFECPPQNSWVLFRHGMLQSASSRRPYLSYPGPQ